MDLGESKIYTGTKQLKAWPMTRGEYNVYRGWELPADEDPKEAGYLVEYLDGGKPNDDRHSGYISWSPADVFERTYYNTTSSKDAAANQIAQDAWEARDRRRVALDFATRLGSEGEPSAATLMRANDFEQYMRGPSAPSTWQERLEAERADLYEKRAKLHTFLASEEFKGYPERVRDLLNRQYAAMDEYYGILIERQRD